MLSFASYFQLFSQFWKWYKHSLSCLLNYVKNCVYKRGGTPEINRHQGLSISNLETLQKENQEHYLERRDILFLCSLD